MIVAIDGNVYTGKTTTIRYAKEKFGVQVIEEYKSVLTLGEKSHGQLEIQKGYFKQEKDRVEKYEKVLKKDVDIYIDRSFLSIIANCYAQYKAYNNDMRKGVLEIFKEKVQKDEILIPNLFVWLNSDYIDLKNRYISGEKGIYKKGTSECLVDIDYCKYIDEFHQKIRYKNEEKYYVSVEYSNTEHVFAKIKKYYKYSSHIKKEELIKLIENILR